MAESIVAVINFTTVEERVEVLIVDNSIYEHVHIIKVELFIK
ncbi:hypothetical protein [Sporanaerobacter acetigenes]|nr:hypothetical protein [Sporanaerobacter acetigenes]